MEENHSTSNTVPKTAQIVEEQNTLEEKLSQYNLSINANDDNYNNFDIKLKEPFQTQKYHTN